MGLLNNAGYGMAGGSQNDIGSGTFGTEKSGFGQPTPPMQEIRVDPVVPGALPDETGGMPVDPTPQAPEGEDPYADPITPPPSPPDDPTTTGDPTGGNNDVGDVISGDGTTVDDLYPNDGEVGDVVGADPVDVADPEGADVTETDDSVTDIDTTEAEDATGRVGDILDEGARKAREIAVRTMERVRKVCGLR